MASRKMHPAGTEVWLCPLTAAARADVLLRKHGTLAADLHPAALKASVLLDDGRTIEVHAAEVKTSPPAPSKPRHGTRKALDPKEATELEMFQ